MENMTNNPLFFASDSIIKESYLSWLCSIAGAENNAFGNRYYILFKTLHEIPFTVIIDRDNNRLNDALKLREMFKDNTCYAIYDCIDALPVSFLELLISLALRMEFIISSSEDIDETCKWVWILLENLNLEWFDDITWDDNSEVEVHYICQRVMDRTYEFDGKGGIFPLKACKDDLRGVELWYQMNYFLNENF